MSISIPAAAAPRIIPKFETNALSAFPFCNPASGTTAGITPVNAGQKIPHINPKNPLVTNKTQRGTSPVAK